MDDSYDDDEYYDFWAEEYDEYKDVTPVLYETERIDFKKYGRRNKTKSAAVTLLMTCLAMSTVTW